MHVAISNDAVVVCQLFPAQRQDCKSFEDICKKFPWNTIKYVVADKGYDTGKVRHIIKTNKAIPVIPPKGIYVLEGASLTPQDCYNTKIYRKRHIIERLFGRLKENKRIAMRFDKLDITFSNFIALALMKLYKLFC